MGGYDHSFLDVQYDDVKIEKLVPDPTGEGKQSSGGFVFNMRFGMDYFLEFSPSFALMLGLDFNWSVGVVDILKQSHPTLGLRIGGAF